nr:MAG TPA: hypothetical protein [Caudoviricetes sp.]
MVWHTSCNSALNLCRFHISVSFFFFPFSNWSNYSFMSGQLVAPFLVFSI